MQPRINSSITFSCKESGLSICKSPEICADLGSPSILNELIDQMKFKKKTKANHLFVQTVQNLNSARMECERRLFAQTAKTLLDRDVEDVQSIVTFCESLDNALGGGIQLGQMTECAGPSGIGKTQLCLQLAVDVCIPKVLGGVDGEVIYIDTEGAFKYKRLKQIAEAAVSHCRRVAETEEQQIAANGFTLSKILSRVHYQRCVDLPTLQRCLKSLLCFIRLHSQVKLVIVDSVAMHLRERFDSALERSHVINNIVLTLLQVATNFHVAIFLVNQITTRFGEDGEPFSVPSVGPLLTSNCAQQLLLFHRQGNLRYARLMKSSTRPPCGAVYTITRNVVIVVVVVGRRRMRRRGLGRSRRLVDDGSLGVDRVGQIWKRGVQLVARAVQQRRYSVEQAGGVHDQQHVLHRLGHRFDEVVVLQFQVAFHEIQNVQPQVDERVERRQRHQVLQKHLAGHGQRPYACLVHATATTTTTTSNSSVVVVVFVVVMMVRCWRGASGRVRNRLLVGVQQCAQQWKQHPVEATFPILAGDLLQFWNQHRPLQKCHRRRADNSAPVAAQPSQCLEQRLPTSRPQRRCGRVEQWRRHFDENQVSQIQQLQRQLQVSGSQITTVQQCLLLVFTVHFCDRIGVVQATVETRFDERSHAPYARLQVFDRHVTSITNQPRQRFAAFHVRVRVVPAQTTAQQQSRRQKLLTRCSRTVVQLLLLLLLFVNKCPLTTSGSRVQITHTADRQFPRTGGGGGGVQFRIGRVATIVLLLLLLRLFSNGVECFVPVLIEALVSNVAGRIELADESASADQLEQSEQLVPVARQTNVGGVRSQQLVQAVGELSGDRRHRRLAGRAERRQRVQHLVADVLPRQKAIGQPKPADDGPFDEEAPVGVVGDQAEQVGVQSAPEGGDAVAVVNGHADHRLGQKDQRPFIDVAESTPANGAVVRQHRGAGEQQGFDQFGQRLRGQVFRIDERLVDATVDEQSGAALSPLVALPGAVGVGVARVAARRRAAQIRVERAEQARRRRVLLLGSGQRSADVDVAATVGEIFAVGQAKRQQFGVVAVQQAVEHAAPSFAQNVAVGVHQVEQRPGGRLCFGTFGKCGAELVGAVGVTRRRQQAAEFAQRDGQVVENVAQAEVGGDRGRLAEAADHAANQRLRVGFVEDERQRRHRRAPDQSEQLAVVQAAAVTGRAQKAALGAGAAAQQHIPDVVLAHQTALFFGHDDLFGPDSLVDFFQHGPVEIVAAVDAVQIFHKLLQRHRLLLAFRLRVVLVHVEHDDRVGEREGGVGAGERRPVRLVPVVGVIFDYGRNFGRFAGQSEAFQKFAQTFVDTQLSKIERFHKRI
ncbi:DNA repair protein RAD51 -like protein 3 [Trichinella nativa]|uniref:DNA repair protein RAD51 homolog 3 n=1 Tax=Trichinella nativa TaxID=6335 RepID=A0A0V1L3S2_9BILA|nr:DNA repair protein RAD51 -like protein 3 [Trichinella nativa]